MESRERKMVVEKLMKNGIEGAGAWPDAMLEQMYKLICSLKPMKEKRTKNKRRVKLSIENLDLVQMYQGLNQVLLPEPKIRKMSRFHTELLGSSRTDCLKKKLHEDIEKEGINKNNQTLIIMN